MTRTRRVMISKLVTAYHSPRIGLIMAANQVPSNEVRKDFRVNYQSTECLPSLPEYALGRRDQEHLVTGAGGAVGTADAPLGRRWSPRGGRGRKDRDEEPRAEAEAAPVIEVEFDNSGFERISDDEDTGEMFKDAFRQEAIIDRVRAAEFDMDSIAEAEVGSLLAEVGGGANGFERIADEEEETPDEEDLDLDLSAGVLDKSNDPVRLYLREMGIVPLLNSFCDGNLALAIE